MASDIDSRLVTILQELQRLTVAGKVKWEAIPPDDESYGTLDTFRYSTKYSTITISSKDGDGSFPSIVILSDSEGNAIEIIRQDDLSITEPLELALREVIDSLRLSARRNALGVDGILNSLMKDLRIEGKEPQLKRSEPPRSTPYGSRAGIVDDPWSQQPAGGYSDEPPF